MRCVTLLALPFLVLPAAARADGDVTTTQTADTITIEGDAADNDYDVKHGTDAMGNDVLLIEGKNGTTINGQPNFELRLNSGPTRFKELHVESGGADDVTVDLSGLPSDRRLDELEVAGGAEGTTTVKNVQMSQSGDIVVKPGGTVSVENCDAESVSVNGGGGGTVTLKSCNVEKKIKVDTSGGDAEVTIQDSFFGDTKLKGGSKVDVQNRLQFRVLRSNGGKVSYESGVADDEISFEDSTVEQLSVKFGGGDDLVWFTGTTIGKLRLDGGPGDADCFDDTADNNVFGSFKEKGFEPCDNVNLTFEGGAGTNALDPETWPAEAVAWRTVNPDTGHLDGPFALPGEGASLGLPERDPAMLAPPAHWGLGPECVEGPVQLQHVHDAWEGHGDPDDDGCGHGVLEWGFFLPG